MFLRRSQTVVSSRMHHRATERRVVYFIRAPQLGLIKIGVANCIHRRLADFGQIIPLDLEVLGVMPCGRQSILEQMLHGKFRHLRERGEWFREDEVLLTYIKEHAHPVPAKPRMTLLERRLMNAARRAKRARAVTSSEPLRRASGGLAKASHSASL